MVNFFPAPAYCFSVSIGENPDSEGAFQEVNGLEAEMEVEEVISGGENNFIYKLPKRTRFPNLVLKRGYFKSNSRVFNWVNTYLLSDANLDELTIKEWDNLNVTLRNEKQEPLMVWKFRKAYPIKISMSNLNAQENAIAIETIEFAHQGFTISK